VIKTTMCPACATALKAQLASALGPAGYAIPLDILRGKVFTPVDSNCDWCPLLEEHPVRKERTRTSRYEGGAYTG